MKKLLFLMLSIWIIPSVLLSQSAMTFGTVTGDFNNIDLSNANQTLIGVGQTQINASDFGSANVLYGINTSTNNFLEIDTLDGSSTVLGNNPPPSSHTWTGMAYDEDSGIMYGISAKGTASGTSSLHTIDVSDGSYTLVGSQSVANSISCIAIDDDGQMYGMNISANAKIYLIDKTNGSVTLLGSTGQGAAGMGHGMDYCSENQTMYLTTYNSITFANTLRIVNLTNGSTTEVGDITGGWTGAIVIPTSFEPAFSADPTTVCLGGTVNFTDETVGSTEWNWTFEGGTPPTSSEQNPSVVYNSTGTFNVTLEVWSGGLSGIISENDYITVIEMPATAVTPVGPKEICSEETSEYTIEEVEGATSYVWTIMPEEAGTIIGDDLTGTVTWASNYEGEAEISAHGNNDCGTGGSEGALIVMVYTQPTPLIEGDDLVCQNADGEYSVAFSEYSTYEWTVDGGDITSGQGTNELTVYWTAAQGSTTYVDVTESKIENCQGIAETFEVTIDECVGVEELTEGNINVFPNPANSILNISLDNISSSKVEIKMFNAQGKIALIKEINNTDSESTTKLDVSNLPQGIYLMSIKSNGIEIGNWKVLITK